MSHIHPPKALLIQIFMILQKCGFKSTIYLTKLFFKWPLLQCTIRLIAHNYKRFLLSSLPSSHTELKNVPFPYVQSNFMGMKKQQKGEGKVHYIAELWSALLEPVVTPWTHIQAAGPAQFVSGKLNIVYSNLNLKGTVWWDLVGTLKRLCYMIFTSDFISDKERNWSFGL